MWLCTIRYISKCEIDVRYYPLDEQKCDLKFGSWSQEATKVAHNILLDIKDLKSSLCLCHRLFCLTQLNLLLGESISRKKILNLFTTSKEFELRDFEGDCWWVIRLCGNWTYFQEEEKSLRTLAAKISLPMWSTQSDCGGDQHEIFSILDIFLQMSEMRSDEIIK